MSVSVCVSVHTWQSMQGLTMMVTFGDNYTFAHQPERLTYKEIGPNL